MAKSQRLIFAIKFVHSVIFVVESAAILYILYCGIVGRVDRWLWVAIALVAAEAAVFFANRACCPLSDLTLKLGADTADDLIADYCMPRWMVPLTSPSCAVLVTIGVVLLIVRAIF